MRKLALLLVFAFLSIGVVACKSKVPIVEIPNETDKGDLINEVAPGVFTVNDLYQDKTVSQWKENYKDKIDIDINNNGILDWKEQDITLTWAFNKGDIGDNPMNNLVWRHAQSFMDKYPNITIKRDNRFLSSVNDSESLNLMVSASQEGSMPDVFYSPLAAEIYDQDLSLDLTPYYRTDPEAAYVAQNIMDFNKSFDGKEYVTMTYRTVATKVLSLNVGLLEELNINVPSYDWTYDEYESLRSSIGALTDAGQCVYPGMYNFSEIGPRYFDGMPGGWKGFNIKTQRFELSKATLFGDWLTEEASESIRGWHYYDLTLEQKTAKCGNLTNAYGDGFQVIDSAVRYWRISESIVKDYIQERGLDIDLYPIPLAPEGGDTVQYGYADTFALGYHLENDPVKAQAAYELARYMSFSEEGMAVRYNFLYEDIETYGETPEDWVAKGNDLIDFPVRHPYRDIIAYAEGFPATTNPNVLKEYPMIKGFPANSYYADHNFGAFQNKEMIRQLTNIVIFPRNLSGFNNVQADLDIWQIRDQIRDEGYYYSDIISNWDDLMNSNLDEYLKNYNKQ